MEGDLSWYYDQSKKTPGLPLRCPYASPDRCPRNYESLYLVDQIGGTSLDPKVIERLDKRWSGSTLTSVLAEQAPSVANAGGQFSTLNHFCPEVTYDTLGWFAKHIHRYVDEIDRDQAHTKLRKEGIDSNDSRWTWSSIRPMHYSECPSYALLLKLPEETEKKANIFSFKPGIYGMTVDLQVLWQWIRRKFRG